MKKRICTVLMACMLPALLMAQGQPVPTPQWRPVYHFTAAKNWLNDPNGLIYHNGVYHLYYQHNPFANVWGHMSWGHAVSKDLLHWEHLPVAIPEKIDKDTTWIFSGSAVYDKQNTSGFGKEGKGPLVAIYTADQPNLKKESQFIAYSNDGGLTYTNYTGNPVIDLKKKDFRDPSVIWLEEQHKWIMTVALPTERKVQFYGSVNLKDWELLSEFGNQGDTRKIWECPSLTPLFVDGNPANKKWLLMISSGNPEAATGLQYFIGDFDGKVFTNNNSADHQMFVDYGRTFYAAIPYNDLPDHRQTMLGWLMPFKTETYPWRGQMSIARDLLLKTTPAGIRLYQQPAAVLETSLEKLPAAKRMVKKDLTINDEAITLNTSNSFNGNANWIAAEFTPGTAAAFGFKLAQQKDNSGRVKEETVVGYNAQNNELYVVQMKNGQMAAQSEKLSVKPVNNKIRLEVLLDRSSLEIFVNDGEKVLTTLIFPAEQSTGLAVFAEKGSVKVDTLKAWDLSR